MRKTSFYMLYVFLLISFILIISLVGDSRTGNVPAASPVPDKESDSSIHNEEKTGLKKAVLEAAVFMEPEQFKMLEKLNKRFESLHSGVTVHIQNIASNHAYKEFKKGSQLGIAPDIMLLDNVWVSEFAALGYLSHRVDEYFTSDMQSRQLESTVAQLKWNGFVWGVPKDIDPYILVWNKQRFSGSKLNRPPLTSDEWITWNHLLYDDRKGIFGVYIDPQDPYAFISLVWAIGGEWNTERDVPALDEKSLSLLKAFFHEGAGKQNKGTGKVIQNGAFDGSEAWDTLEQGKIAMMIATASDYNRNIAKGALKGIGLAELPMKKTGESSSWLKGTSYAVSSRSDHEEEALKWIETMTGEETQIMLMMAGSGFPTYVSSYQRNDVQDRTRFSILRNSILYGRMFPAQPQLPQKLLLLQSEIEKVLSGNANAQKLGFR